MSCVQPGSGALRSSALPGGTNLAVEERAAEVFSGPSSRADGHHGQPPRWELEGEQVGVEGIVS